MGAPRITPEEIIENAYKITVRQDLMMKENWVHYE